MKSCCKSVGFLIHDDVKDLRNGLVCVLYKYKGSHLGSKHHYVQEYANKENKEIAQEEDRKKRP